MTDKTVQKIVKQLHKESGVFPSFSDVLIEVALLSGKEFNLESVDTEDNGIILIETLKQAGSPLDHESLKIATVNFM